MRPDPLDEVADCGDEHVLLAAREARLGAVTPLHRFLWAQRIKCNVEIPTHFLDLEICRHGFGSYAKHSCFVAKSE